MKSVILSTLMGAAMLAQPIMAHPGQSKEEAAQEIAERRAYLANNKRSLSHCADSLKARGNDVAMHARRAAAVERLRAKRAIAQEKPYLRVRDLSDALSTSHKSNLTGITVDTDASILFAGNNSCILTPEVTQGPYWVKGELVREDITEDQAGVPLTLDIQIIDVDTCEPVPQAFLEIWHCNSTGVYSGVVANGNGDSSDPTNIDNTFLRGIQQSDDDGVVVIDTLFPGHYSGRATHIHVMTSQDATVNENQTLSGGSITHVGQMFFDQDLISLVSAVEPYAGNTQSVTLNSADSILSEEASDVDPFIEYVLLGDDVSEGLFGWLAFGMDTKNSFNVTPAAYLTENGGVANANGGIGGSPPNGSGGSPSGVRPTGAMPTDAAPSGTAAASSVAVGTTLSIAVASSAASLASELALSASSFGTRPPVALSNGPQGGFGHGSGRPTGTPHSAHARPSGTNQPSQPPKQQQQQQQRPQAQYKQEQGPQAQAQQQRPKDGPRF